MRYMILALLTGVLAFSVGCSTREVATGAAVGGAGYEYANKRQMDQLKKDYEAGRITQEEYQERKSEIEGRSVVY